ncbi:hypothetical protein [Liberiplasma polymorphum]|uniref:hypothetical protein n=1 Tax=Liberiplasma polymorphum TaxID=3374570 RepID=UPI003770BE6E
MSNKVSYPNDYGTTEKMLVKFESIGIKIDLTKKFNETDAFNAIIQINAKSKNDIHSKDKD